MTENGGPTGSDSAAIDADGNTVAGFDDIPDMADADVSLVTWRIGGRVVGEAEGRAAMAAALAASREHVELDLPGDVVVAFRAEGGLARAQRRCARRRASSDRGSIPVFPPPGDLI